MAASLSFYLIGVQGRTLHWYESFDRRWAIVPHALVNGLIAWSGIWLGLALFTSLDHAQTTRWRPYAVLVILLSMVSSILWGIPSLNAFVDAHSALLVEGQTLTYTMGVISGVAWWICLQQSAGYALLLAPAGMCMMISAMLSVHSW